MVAFETLVRSLFHDPHFTLAAIYTRSGQKPQTVSTIESREPEEDALLSVGTRRSTTLFDVAVSAIPVQPIEGDTLIVRGVTYRIRSATADELGLTWLLDVDLV